MKKIVLTLAAASLIVSCKKIPKGGNHGVLKLEEGVERYDTYERRYEDQEGHHSTHEEGSAHHEEVTNHEEATHQEKNEKAEEPKTDSIKVEHE